MSGAHKMVRFDSLPIGARFVDAWGYGPCVKVSATTARDSWCAPGMCFGVRPDEMVEVL